MQILQAIPIIFLFLAVAIDVIIGIFFDPPFVLTKIVLIILSIIFGSQEKSLIALGTGLWWIATFGGFAVVFGLVKKPLFALIAGGTIGFILFVFRIVSPFGSAAMALAYPKFIYLVFEFIIFMPFVTIIIFLNKFTESE